jgi:hypothetical protein
MSQQETPHHDQLPLPDYDHLTMGDLVGRIRSLGEDQLQVLLDYERTHGDRLPVVTVLDQRIGQLRGGAQPSGGDPTADTPELQHAPPPPSKAGPATEGPPVNPPSHGYPTNPAQPRG